MDDELVHDYDAVKRREYYLRTRKLKGRAHAIKAPPKKTPAQRAAERRKHQEAQIAALKSRLERLRDVLAAETKKAQARSGASSSTTATAADSSASTQKLTPVQKAKKAAAEKKAREKDQTLNEQIKSLTEKVKKILERIAKMRQNGSVGAKRTTTK